MFLANATFRLMVRMPSFLDVLNKRIPFFELFITSYASVRECRSNQRRFIYVFPRINDEGHNISSNGGANYNSSRKENRRRRLEYVDGLYRKRGLRASFERLVGSVGCSGGIWSVSFMSARRSDLWRKDNEDKDPGNCCCFNKQTSSAFRSEKNREERRGCEEN